MIDGTSAAAFLSYVSPCLFACRCMGEQRSFAATIREACGAARALRLLERFSCFDPYLLPRSARFPDFEVDRNTKFAGGICYSIEILSV